MFKQCWAPFIRTLWKPVCKGSWSTPVGRYPDGEVLTGSPAPETKTVSYLLGSQTFARVVLTK